MKNIITGANPYLPLWEHIPDGEPKVFTYNGEKRVYVYGSHDTLKTEYCGTDYVVWSAPINDLTDWRCEGVCYKSSNGEPLYAPDVVERNGVYYMYAAEDRGSKVYVASSKNPAGPFTNPVLTELGFDPGILVDDDGKVYAYWGFCKMCAAELNDDMATIKKETFVENMIPHAKPLDFVADPDFDHIDTEFGFFEASSIRKIGSKYVYIYSRRLDEPDLELGFPKDTNGYLDYAYSDKPLGEFIHGGMISYNCGDIYTKPDGTKARAYTNGNNHGSIVNADGQWYVFYHRQTGTDEFSRQGMLEPIDVAVDKDGKVYIGKVTFDGDGEPVLCEAAEMTSQGAYKDGIDAYSILSAGYACWLTPADNGEQAYIKPIYEGCSAPVVNIKSGTIVGFKYMQFGEKSPQSITINVNDMLPDGKISVVIDSPEGTEIAELVSGEDTAEITELISGKHAIYFIFKAENKNADICIFDSFTFNK